MRRPRLLFVQMGAVKQRRRQSREAGALGVEANARRRLAMKTEQALPAGTNSDLAGTEEPPCSNNCGSEVMVAGAGCGGRRLLEGDCLAGILAFLGAKALCHVMRTCRSHRALVRQSCRWSTFGPRTGRDKLRAWQAATQNAVGATPQPHLTI